MLEADLKVVKDSMDLMASWWIRSRASLVESTSIIPRIVMRVVYRSITQLQILELEPLLWLFQVPCSTKAEREISLATHNITYKATKTCKDPPPVMEGMRINFINNKCSSKCITNPPTTLEAQTASERQAAPRLGLDQVMAITDKAIALTSTVTPQAVEVGPIQMSFCLRARRLFTRHPPGRRANRLWEVLWYLMELNLKALEILELLTAIERHKCNFKINPHFLNEFSYKINSQNHYLTQYHKENNFLNG